MKGIKVVGLIEHPKRVPHSITKVGTTKFPAHGFGDVDTRLFVDSFFM
jgi:hypothetical protein